MKKLLLTALMAITHSISYGMHNTEATERMFATLRAGNYSLNDISSLLDAKANPGALDQDGLTPLYYAVDRSDSQLIAFLCTYGADPNQVIPGLTHLDKKN